MRCHIFWTCTPIYLARRVQRNGGTVFGVDEGAYAPLQLVSTMCELRGKIVFSFFFGIHLQTEVWKNKARGELTAVARANVGIHRYSAAFLSARRLNESVLRTCTQKTQCLNQFSILIDAFSDSGL